MLAAIGPVWDGNEVWLIASGGVLFFAFPRAYAAAFSGFYLPLMIVAVAAGRCAACRSSSAANGRTRCGAPSGTWRSPSPRPLLALVLGAALGNVIRGVPLGADGAFAAPLFGDGGALDWYTVLVGLFAVAALSAHGAAYLSWKCEDELYERSRRLLHRALPVAAVLGVAVTAGTWRAQPALFTAFAERPWAWPLLPAIVAAPALAWRWSSRGRDRAAFLASSGFLAALLGATAASLFPVILRSTIDARYDATAAGAATGHHGLVWGLTWWLPALGLAVAYFVHLFRSFAGKVRASHY